MVRRLVVAGSNSGHQLGVGHDQDVPTFQESLCRLEGDLQDVPFPPPGYEVVGLSSGANHTLALLESDLGAREVWVTGTGEQGQLGPAGAEPYAVFTPLNLQQCLQGIAPPLGNDMRPKQVVAGWNCSYIVLGPPSGGAVGATAQDVLISLGSHRDNTFGELGCAAPLSEMEGRCVHLVSFASVLVEAELSLKSPLRILDIAAGLRHAVVALSVGGPEACTIVAGWGAARHGQVGRVPAAPPRIAGLPRRPGAAAASVSEPQLIFKWKTTDARPARCKVRAGRDHSVVLLLGRTDGEGAALHCIGSNKQSQIVDVSALPVHAATSTMSRIVDITCNWTSTHCLFEQQDGSSADHQILSCGSNGRGQLGNGSTEPASDVNRLTAVDLRPVLRGSVGDVVTPSPQPAGRVTVKKLVAGSEHSLLLISRQNTAEVEGAMEVWGWGWNEHGNLAQGQHDEADHDRPVLLLDGARAGAALAPCYIPMNIWAGCGTTFILVDRMDP